MALGKVASGHLQSGRGTELGLTLAGAQAGTSPQPESHLPAQGTPEEGPPPRGHCTQGAGSSNITSNTPWTKRSLSAFRKALTKNILVIKFMD